MPWRLVPSSGTVDSYKILVSELMLQQTQVSRVIPKFNEFTRQFLTVQDLANANLADVLKLWSGLGYNRRAKYLHDAAKHLALKPQPWLYEDLIACKGIGPNTAKAILVYAYNSPQIFIETNIRTVYIHYFFNNQSNITDTQILDLVKLTVNTKNPRRWYWALMDIGAYLKSRQMGAISKSSGYKVQSKFNGSLRQVRGNCIKLLSQSPLTLAVLKASCNDLRVEQVLKDLCQEGLIYKSNDTYHLGSI